jgi:hypothetical protein
VETYVNTFFQITDLLTHISGTESMDRTPSAFVHLAVLVLGPYGLVTGSDNSLTTLTLHQSNMIWHRRMTILWPSCKVQPKNKICISKCRPEPLNKNKITAIRRNWLYQTPWCESSLGQLWALFQDPRFPELAAFLTIPAVAMMRMGGGGVLLLHTTQP